MGHSFLGDTFFSRRQFHPKGSFAFAMSGQRDMFAAFQAYDKNGDGTLTADELMGILLNPRTGTPMTLSDAEEFVACADTNGEREGSGGP